MNSKITERGKGRAAEDVWCTPGRVAEQADLAILKMSYRTSVSTRSRCRARPAQRPAAPKPELKDVQSYVVTIDTVPPPDHGTKVPRLVLLRWFSTLPAIMANADKELYRELRRCTPAELWKKAAAFDQSVGKERITQVAVIRAIGVVMNEKGSAHDQNHARAWLTGLLNDPEEKIRRYAINALPKFGADSEVEKKIIRVLTSSNSDREKKYATKSLEKIGGRESLVAVGPASSQQKIRSALSRGEGSICIENKLNTFSDWNILLRCRNGLEETVAEEAEKTLRIEKTLPGLVIARAKAPFSIEELYRLRCFATVGFASKSNEGIVSLLCSPKTLALFAAFNEGPVRYRIEFLDKGHQRGAVRKMADEIYSKCPDLLNSPSQARWTVAIDGNRVEIRPRLTPDPRFDYRQQDVPAASHPPLAACLARLAESRANDVVWDPFCGSGLELIERALLGGVRKVVGTDQSAEAIQITQKNFASALNGNVEEEFKQIDFRKFEPDIPLTLIITNPPMGKRVPIADLRGLINDLFQMAARLLPKGGRLALVNPLKLAPPARVLKLAYAKTIDMGGFHCRLEKYVKE